MVARTSHIKLSAVECDCSNDDDVLVLSKQDKRKSSKQNVEVPTVHCLNHPESERNEKSCYKLGMYIHKFSKMNSYLHIVNIISHIILFCTLLDGENSDASILSSSSNKENVPPIKNVDESDNDEYFDIDQSSFKYDDEYTDSSDEEYIYSKADDSIYSNDDIISYTSSDTRIPNNDPPSSCSESISDDGSISTIDQTPGWTQVQQALDETSDEDESA